MENKKLVRFRGDEKNGTMSVLPILLCFNWFDSCYICTCSTFLLARMMHFNKTPLKGLTLTFYREKHPSRVCGPPVVSHILEHKMWCYSDLLLNFTFICGFEYMNYGSLFGLIVSLFLFISNFKIPSILSGPIVNFKSNHRSISVVRGFHVFRTNYDLLSFSQTPPRGTWRTLSGRVLRSKWKKRNFIIYQIYAPDALYLTLLISSHAQASFWVKGVCPLRSDLHRQWWRDLTALFSPLA